MPDDDMPKILEGLWWKRDRGVSGSVSLTNTTDQPRAATLRFIRPGEDSDSKEMQLPAHATQVLALEQFSREESEDDSRAGGIRVQYNGPPGAILVNGSLANESEGYSANMPFWSHNLLDTSAKKINMGSAGIMVGKPDPMMMPGFPARTRFEPYLTLRNTTSERLAANLQVNYMTGMEGAAPVNRQLPAQVLRPLEAKQVRLSSMLDEAGLKSFNGMINLSISFTGHGGDVIAATGSVDQTGTYVFEVAPEVVGSILGKITGYWSVAKGNDAMYSLWNPSDAPQDVLATFYYGDGSGTYQVPVHLDPQASTMLDVAMLIMEKKPDPNGNVIPSNIQEGSASFASSTNQGKITVVVAGGLFNVSTATCGEICNYCNGYSNFALNPVSVSIPVGGSQQFSAKATDSYGILQNLYWGTWGTSNNAIATVDGQGNVTGEGVGQTSVTDLLQNTIVFQGNYCVNENMNDSCPTANPQPGAEVTVTPPTATISLAFTNSKSKGDALRFSAASYDCSESLDKHNCPNTSVWLWNMEGTATVSDDASKWTVRQSYTGRKKGYYKDVHGNLQSFDINLNVSNDNPSSSVVQQPSGQKTIFWLDAPGHFYSLSSGPIDSMTQVENFTTQVCSTTVLNDCSTTNWYLKLVIKPGAQMDTTNTSAGTGTQSTNF